MPPGWSVEERTTANGRKYVVYHGPNDESARSRAAMWRAVAPGAACAAGEGAPAAAAPAAAAAAAAAAPPAAAAAAVAVGDFFL